ncbi:MULTISPECIES: glycosyltransferase [Clostridium]|nr:MULTISPECIES: glycosyltransferase [Clostridium]MDU1068722.1 glycosyltransferase [Clostridium sp.]MDU1336965.1 glycosyltransferase [Clostridium butyricum]MDU2676306.1 glycosyltransferase [Clostridium sp.]MDU4210657.1 glycosyltransferase [Clostridium sp.]MDU5173911.1 glycosyltransferase [Clostridium sp.]
MIEEVQLLKNNIKNNIENMIDNKRLEEATHLLEEYFKLDTNDIEIYSMFSVIYILENKLEKAKNILEEGLKIEEDNFDLNYNLGYVYELMEEEKKACIYYKRAYKKSNDLETKKIIEEYINRIEGNVENLLYDKEKISFFVKPGMDSFIDDIIDEFSKIYETRKIVVTNYSQIDENMKWADICWFEWCDELIEYGSRVRLEKEKKIVCRIHGYEVYTDNINKVEWGNVNNIIIVTPHIRRLFEEKISNANLETLRIDTVFCGVNIERYPLIKRSKGFNIGYLGYLNFKKNIPLTLDIFKKLYDIDNRYRLHLAGEFQDARTFEYFKYFVKENNLEKSIVFYGWQNFDQKLKWFEKIDYMVISSIDEGLCFAAAESMCSGIKPVLHNCEGIKDHYDEKYIFNTIDEAVNMIIEEEYNSDEYRKFIENNYCLEKEYNSIYKVLKNNDEKENNHDKVKKNIGEDRKKNPLITIGVINYNNNRYIDDCLDSILKQEYNNIEVIIVDDCSKDGSLEKIKKYEKENESIRGIYHKENMGNGSYACEDIIRESKGDYFIFIASDDYFCNNEVINNYLDEFKKNKFIDYVYGNLVTVNENKEKIGEYIYTQFMNDEIVKDTFEKMGSGILTMTGMFKKSFYEKNDIKWITPKENKVAPDTLNSLIAIKNNIKIQHMNKFVLSYRQHDSNGTLNYKERVKSIRSVIDYIINNFSEEIYAPQINWNDMNDEIRKCSKLFLAGGHYLKTAIYYRDYWCPFGRNLNLKNEEKKKYIRPLLERAKKYFELSVNIGDFYKRDIDNMLKEDIFDI